MLNTARQTVRRSAADDFFTRLLRRFADWMNSAAAHQVTRRQPVRRRYPIPVEHVHLYARAADEHL